MRYLVLLFLLCGCASSNREQMFQAEASDCRLGFWGRNGFHSHEFERCYQRELVLKEKAKPNPEKERAEKELAENKERVKMKPGISMSEYIKYWGDPTTKELVNKKNIFWYELDEPFFVVFENDQLISWIIDRQTISERSATRNAEIRNAALIDAEERASRRRAIGQAMQQIGQGFQNSSVNCTSSQFGRTTYTNCR